MSFSSILRFEKAVLEFTEHRRNTSQWTDDDILYLVEEILRQDRPVLMIEAEIDAEIHREVRWNQCPGCGTALGDEDRERRCGFCMKCFMHEGAPPDDKIRMQKEASARKRKKTGNRNAIIPPGPRRTAEVPGEDTGKHSNNISTNDEQGGSIRGADHKESGSGHDL